MAPQAMVIKMKGKTWPGMTGPPPPVNCVRAGIFNSGWTKRIPTASVVMVAIFRYVDR